MRTKANLPAKRPSKRAIALGACRIAGYHDDTRTFVRTYIEGRISYGKATEQWHKGQQMKKSGVICECFHCKQEKEGNGNG